MGLNTDYKRQYLDVTFFLVNIQNQLIQHCPLSYGKRKVIGHCLCVLIISSLMFEMITY